MTTLKTLLIAGGAALALQMLPVGTGPAHAAAWCAYAGGSQAYENCGYHTFAQCRAAVSGVGGDCRINPRYRGERAGPRGYYDDVPPPPPPRRSRY